MVQENFVKNDVPLLIICGPTASGKTELAVECAKLLHSEVISADSMNVYKELNIGTAKPSLEERMGVRHHLIDVVSPFDSFSVGDYKELAEPIVEKLTSLGKTPVICGGTGFYINSLLYDFSYGNVAENTVAREKYKALALKEGNEYVYNVLRKVDEKSADRIHPNDIKRVIRALEIYENGTKKSDIIDSKVPKRKFLAFSYDIPRDELYEKINNRVDLMIKNGLIDEVKGLILKGLNETHQSLQGIGYKEIFEYLSGRLPLDEAVEKIKLNTRHYAKRQITFFKKIPDLIYLKKEKTKQTAERIVTEYDKYRLNQKM